MLLKLCVSLVLLHAVSCQDSGFEPPWGSEWSEAWSDRGCYRAPSNAALTSFAYTSSDIERSRCLANCEGKGFQFAGLTNGKDCYCGSAMATGAGKVSDRECDMPCVGDSEDICGGPTAMSLFTLQVAARPPAESSSSSATTVHVTSSSTPIPTSTTTSEQASSSTVSEAAPSEMSSSEVINSTSGSSSETSTTSPITSSVKDLAASMQTTRSSNALPTEPPHLKPTDITADSLILDSGGQHLYILARKGFLAAWCCVVCCLLLCI